MRTPAQPGRARAEGTGKRENHCESGTLVRQCRAGERSMHQNIESVLNEGARDTARPISQPANFASRPWTHADDDKLRRLALTGLSVRAIGIRMSRTETAVHSRARRLHVILRKIRPKQLQMG
jgi:hypothetical protein